MASRNALIIGIVAILVIVVVAVVALSTQDDSNDTCRVTFAIDRDTEFQTIEVDSGSKVPEPVSPNISNEERFYFVTGWSDSQGNLWDFDDPVSENMTLYAEKQLLCNTYCSGFELNLNINTSVGDGWSHYISWGDGDTSSYPDSIQPDHTYSRSGTYTITIQSTSPAGESYVSQHLWTPLCDSVGVLVPLTNTSLAPRVTWNVTDEYGNDLGRGYLHVYGHEVDNGTLNGRDLDQSTIDRINEIRDLSHARVYSDGMWTYTRVVDSSGSMVPGDFEVFRIVYDSGSYDLISENGFIISMHVGGDINLNYDWGYFERGYWTKQ